MKAQTCEREPELVRDRREQPVVGGAERTRTRRRDEDDRPDGLSSHAHGHAAHVFEPPLSHRARSRRYDADPAAGLAPLFRRRRLATAEHHRGGPKRRARQRDRLAVAGIGLHADRALLAEDNEHGRQLELSPDPLGDGGERALDLRLGHQAHHVVQHHRLALARLGLSRALAQERGQLARDDARDEKQHEGENFVVASDVKRVVRLEEEEVESEKRGDGSEDRRAAPEEHGARHDGEQVEHRGVAHIRHDANEGDGAGHHYCEGNGAQVAKPGPREDRAVHD